ncbi:carboxypeptidase regulatory-like domain-containing protein [Nocardioides sp. cx-169]|uniref:carboxypeptidase-like regulatory domain-containing protein n=1 Tax=Nocardioides sp. cx-169 TaxID=2899080 RepID=UPI001E342907|nr:carboxypeptidase-like regulatory domain-containing protein [Nocardioides sp. cx-169]MCD4532706.1 carboxypeptidase regulatory-like domain-containing protein [Nocardioides sp. cx-169]
MSSVARHLSRPLVALLAMLLVLPLSQLLVAAPAHAVAFQAQGIVTDALDNPLSGVTVTAYEGSVAVGTPVATAADGAYALTLPRAGSYTLGFSKSGFVSTSYGGDPAEILEVNAQGDITASGDDEPYENNELDTVTLTSVVTRTLSGTAVAAAGGAPLSGVSVSLFAAGDESEALAATTTDSLGAFSFSVPKGRYQLYLAHPSYSPRWFGDDAPVVVDSTDAPTGAIALTIVAEGTRFPIAGRLVDAFDEGVNGASVTVTGAGVTSGVHTGTTSGSGDEAGAYSVSVLPGTYEVEFSAPGFLTQKYTSDDVTATISVSNNGTLSVTPADALTSNRLNDVTLPTQAFPVGGRVTATSGAPLSAITVTAVDADGVAVAPNAVTNSAGAYSLSLRAGIYTVRATDANGDATSYDTTWLGGNAVPAVVTVARGGAVSVGGQPAPLPDLVMPPSSPDTPHPVVGEVVDVNGDGIDRLTVTATKAGTSTVAATADTGPDGDLGDHGRFRLALKAGSYTISVAAARGFAAGAYVGDGERTATVTVALNGLVTATDTEVEGNDLGSITLVGTATSALSGTVLKEGGAGLDQITVIATPMSGATTRTAKSGANGAFTLNLPVDTYRIQYVDDLNDATTYTSAYYGGTTPALVKIANDGSFSADDTPISGLASVTLSVASASVPHPVKGTVYDPDYTPLSGVTVTATPVSPTPAGHQVTGTTGPDPDAGSPLGDAGVYKLMLLPGSYRLTYTKAGYQPTPLASFDAPGTPVTLTVGLDGRVRAPGLEMAGNVVDDVQLLLPAPRMLKAPKLTGKLVYGQVVTTTFGTWRPDFGKDNAFIEWFLNGKPADSFTMGNYGEKFRVPASAVGKRLSYRIQIDDPDGVMAPAVYTSKPTAAIKKAPSAVSGKFKKGKLTVTVKVPGVPKPTGRITVFDGKKKVGTFKLSAKSKGKGVIKLKLKKGKHKLTIKYVGPGAVKPGKKVLKIKV